MGQNFTHICPMGWRLDEGSFCVAPDGYSGSCLKRKRFQGISVAEKADWGATCAAEWPCREEVGTAKGQSVDCEMNLMSLCPSGWRNDGDICIAPPSYRGKCALSFTPRQYTTKMKQEWSRICEAHW